MRQYFSHKNKIKGFVFLLTGLIVTFKALESGTDINVYLYASKQFFSGNNIYAGNPYNQYLYSPFFAFILGIFSHFNFDTGRVIWALINLVLAFRIYDLLLHLVEQKIHISRLQKSTWSFSLIFVSLMALLHNFNLGQITTLILWLTVEALYQVQIKQKVIPGAALLAMGICIKILPVLGLLYLFIKRRYKAALLCILFLVIYLLTPAIVIGLKPTINLTKNWIETINPQNDKYIFESDNGTQSLNAILPAYFYSFENAEETKPNRTIIAVPHQTLVYVLQILRILILFSSLLLLMYRYKRNLYSSLYFLWELAYLCLATVLVFPHQQKYALLYFVPAVAYMSLIYIVSYSLKSQLSSFRLLVYWISGIIMLCSGIAGRDIIGNTAVDIYDHFHIGGIINLLFLFVLLYSAPQYLIKAYEKHAHPLLPVMSPK